MTADHSIVNLNKARKAKERKAARANADANAVKFGRTKAERATQAREAAKLQRALDQAKRDE